jgi:hypothetical protein
MITKYRLLWMNINIAPKKVNAFHQACGGDANVLAEKSKWSLDFTQAKGLVFMSLQEALTDDELQSPFLQHVAKFANDSGTITFQVYDNDPPSPDKFKVLVLTFHNGLIVLSPPTLIDR